jgi:RNA polymerase sigma-70 factor (ECF subfamily)
MQAVSDEQLIIWVANGDSSCLGTLFERHHRGVHQFCLRMTRNNAQAEDVVQEVFIKVLNKAGSFRGDGTFKGWLYNIARNATMDSLRKHKQQGPTMAMDPLADSLMVDHRSAEQSAAGQQGLNALETALARLPKAFQEIIWLGRFEFDSYEELAQAIGCKTGTARVRMHRAMKQLNEAFTEINGAPINA